MRLIYLALLSTILFTVEVPAQPSAEGQEGASSATTAYVDYYARDTFRIDTVVCPFKGDIDYEPGDIECGLLQVPENREDPDSRFIELHFAKIKATEEEETRDDPIIYLTGGPGVMATPYIDRLKDHGVVKHRDLYILEQRGIGYSGDFCPFYSTRKPELSDVETFEEQLEAGLNISLDCAENAAAKGIDLTAYNTIENARDVHVLRQALGFGQWNVWGISYGSILGQALLNTDPEGIRAIALDAIVPLDFGADISHLRIAKWYDRDLRKLSEACAADEACAEHYGDFADRLRAAVELVRDEPIVVEVKDTERFPSGEARVFQDLIAFLPFIFLYEQDDYPGLPGLIYALVDSVEQGNDDLFKALATFDGGIDMSAGMYDAIGCTDGWAEPNIAAAAADMEEFPVLGSALGPIEFYERAAQACRDAGVPPRDRSEYRPVHTDIPALIIEGDMDPITPPPLAKAILPGFTNATYVEFPYAGHGPSRSVECAGEMLTAFYDAPEDEPDLSCVETMEAPEFFAPLFQTWGPARFFVMAQEDKKAVLVPALWGSSSILVLLIAFLTLSGAPILRFVDGRAADPTFGARPLAWLTALAGTAAAATFGAAFAATYDASEGLMLVGLVPWARFAAYAGLLTGVFGLFLIALSFRARGLTPLRKSTLFGFLLTGAAAVSFSAFLHYWDFGPF